MRKLPVVTGLMLAASICWAHLPLSVVYPAVQFPDTHIPAIDGNLADWDAIPTAYWITHEQLTETVRGVGTSWDATDMSLKAIVGWNPASNKLFLMEDRFDDHVFVLTGWDSIEMEFDADHSGGEFGLFENVSQEEQDRMHGAQAQNYGINNAGPGLFAWHKATWHDKAPWGGWASTQTAPEGGEGFFRAEYMLTGWDDLDWHGPEVSKIHQLRENDVIGFNFTVVDNDEGPGTAYQGYWTLSGATDSWKQGDLLSDFVLAPMDPDIKWGAQTTAVDEVSWGRLKATFAE